MHLIGRGDRPLPRVSRDRCRHHLPRGAGVDRRDAALLRRSAWPQDGEPERRRPHAAPLARAALVDRLHDRRLPAHAAQRLHPRDARSALADAQRRPARNNGFRCVEVSSRVPRVLRRRSEVQELTPVNSQLPTANSQAKYGGPTKQDPPYDWRWELGVGSWELTIVL